MDALPLVLAVVSLALGVFSIVNVDRMTTSGSGSNSFFHQRRGRLLIGWLFVLVGVLWLAAALT